MTSTMPMHESIYTAEERAEIREKLKSSVDYGDASQSERGSSDKYEPKADHLESVPFEGAVYHSAGSSLNTREIDKKYKQSLTPVWWIVIQSVLAFFRRSKKAS